MVVAIGRKPLRTSKYLGLHTVNSSEGLLSGKPYRNRKGRRWRWWFFLNFLFFLPALIALTLPSYEIARVSFRAPSFDIPNSLQRGDLLVIPASEEIIEPRLEGRELTPVQTVTSGSTASPRASLIGAIPATDKVTLSFSYVRNEAPLSFGTIWRKFFRELKHPSLYLFSKDLTVTSSEETPGNAGKVVNLPVLAKLQSSGAAKVGCWKAPTPTPLPVQFTWSRRTAEVPSAGPGKIVDIKRVSAAEDSLYEVTIDHGGGLFSRFTNMNRVDLANGEPVTAGQVMGTMWSGTWKTPIALEWSAYLKSNDQAIALNLGDFLELSSRLCDSK